VNEKIQLVAFDFDETIINIHTGGVWDESTLLLVEHVRPEMVCFLYHCIYQYNIPVAITTFSTQKQLIQNVLQQSLMNYHHYQHQQEENDRQHPDDNIEKNANNNLPQVIIPVFGWDDHVRGYDYGKQSQLYLARQYYFYNRDYNQNDMKQQQQQQQQQSKQQKFVRKQQQQQRRQQRRQQKDNDNNIIPLRQHTVLIDDDYKNIRIAKIDGYRTIHYNLDNTNNENILVLLDGRSR
jgi:hypothetical protein